MELFAIHEVMQRKLVLTAATTPRTSSRVSWLFLLLVQATNMLPTMAHSGKWQVLPTVWEASVTVQVLCEMSKYEQDSLVHIYWVHWQCIVPISWSSLLLRITCEMATLFHKCSLLGFVSSFHSTLSKVWGCGTACRNATLSSARVGRAIQLECHYVPRSRRSPPCIF